MHSGDRACAAVGQEQRHAIGHLDGQRDGAVVAEGDVRRGPFGAGALEAVVAAPRDGRDAVDLPEPPNPGGLHPDQASDPLPALFHLSLGAPQLELSRREEVIRHLAERVAAQQGRVERANPAKRAA